MRTDLAARTIRIDTDQLRAIPEVVVISYGTAQRPAALAALCSGLVDCMVTHRALAEALLSEA